VLSDIFSPFDIVYYSRYFKALAKYRKKRTSYLVIYEKYREILPVIRKNNTLKKRGLIICSEKQRISYISYSFFSLTERILSYIYIIVISEHKKINSEKTNLLISLASCPSV
jgi:hypothetical protein